MSLPFFTAPNRAGVEFSWRWGFGEADGTRTIPAAAPAYHSQLIAPPNPLHKVCRSLCTLTDHPKTEEITSNPRKPRSSIKPGNHELHCLFCLCKSGCIWSPTTCETSRISWKVVVIGSRTVRVRMVGHVEVIRFLVTFGGPFHEKKRKCIEKVTKRTKAIASMIHFPAFSSSIKLNVSEWHVNPGGPTCKAHGWCKDSSHFPPNLCTGTKSLQHRFQHWKRTRKQWSVDLFDSFSQSLKLLVPSWQPLTIQINLLGVDVSKFRNAAPLFTLNVESNELIIISDWWGHFGLQCFHGFVWHGHPGGHAKCSWSKTTAPRPCQSKSIKAQWGHEMSHGEKAPTITC